MSLCVLEWGMARWLLVLALAANAELMVPEVQPPRCPPEDRRCTPIGGDTLSREYAYKVDALTIGFDKDAYFTIKCPDFFSLDNSAMPRFESQLRVFKAQMKNCPAPRDSYGAVLQRLNVSVSDMLMLVGAGQLSGAHLADLVDLHELKLVDSELAPRTLAALAGLHSLFLDNVRLPPGELGQLPTSLQMLQLIRMGADVPRDVLTRLPNLVNVTVLDSNNVSVAVGGALQSLALDMPAARVPSALTATLRILTVFGWAERSPAPWTACALDTLNLRDVTAEKLPAHWVSECVNLTVLHVQFGAHLRELHATSLRGARHLRDLRLTSCVLEALPVGLLDDALELSVLDLSGNFLKELPSGLFVRTRSLHTLNLSKNRLTTNVYTSLKAVTSLSSLKLSYNDLRDSCGGADDTVRGVSPLESLNMLTNLDLRKTNTSLICRDWRENMPLLKTLNLSWNNFTTVTYADLQFHPVVTNVVKVDLSHNNVRKLWYTKDDYRLVTGANATSRVNVKLDDKLDCDCDTYWAARALQERGNHVQLTAKCARKQEPRDLHNVALDTLVCAAPELCVAARGCVCEWRDSGVNAPARMLRVSCERAGLTRLADVLTPLSSAVRNNHKALDDYDWQLYLAHNRIGDLIAADIPKHLSVLDLRNNSLSLLSEDAVRPLLVEDRRRVLLAHNKLACNCSAYDALATMRAYQARLDYNTLTCADGSKLSRARPPLCVPPRSQITGPVAAGVIVVSLLAIAGLLWHPALRLRLKAALLLPRKFHAEPDDDERRFDVFLSFSHGDEHFVRNELVARLESGPVPYRLCVHYRDWVPGGWIPAQIAASVRASRRTVAVVSAHFLRSAWARAEFQEAYALALRDARPRLVVVLLDDPAALPLDDKLRSYLATNTYVRWGDPWFWQKLRLALPRGRGPAPPASGEVYLASSMVSSLNSSQSSSCSSSSSAASSLSSPQRSTASSSSTAGSAEELRWLVAPASCSVQLPGTHVNARAVPV